MNRATTRRRRSAPRKRRASRGPVHTRKWDRCIADVKAKGRPVDPYAVCTASLGERGSIRPGHRRTNPRRSGYAIIAKSKRSARMLKFCGDRFAPFDDREHKALLFPSRAMALQWRDMLLAVHARKLANWTLAVQ